MEAVGLQRSCWKSGRYTGSSDGSERGRVQMSQMSKVKIVLVSKSARIASRAQKLNI